MASWRSILMVFWLVSACAEELVELGNAQKQTKDEKKAAAAVAAGDKASSQEEAFRYVASGKRDPFRSYFDVLKKAGLVQLSKTLDELEMYEVAEYRLTGLISGTSQPLAFVQDPKGKGHVLRLGSRFGNLGGRVTQITQEGIVVTQNVVQPAGGKKRVQIAISLYPAIEKSGLARQ